MSGPRSTLRRLLAARLGRPGRLVAAVVAVLVLASSVAALPVVEQPSPERDAPTGRHGSMATAAAPVVQVANTTGYLALPADSVRTTGFAAARLDPAAAVAVQTARLHGRYATIRLRESFAAETDAGRRAVVRNTTRRIDARIDRLERRQARALAAYNRGDLSKQAFLRELVAVDAAADATEATVDQLYTYDRATGMPVSKTQIAELKARLIPLQGPVRTLAAERMADGSGGRVHVTTSGSGIVLATVEEGEFTTRYVREAFYGGGFDDRFTDRPIDIEAFEQRISERYPWTWANNGGTNSLLTSEPQYLHAGIYGIAVNHPHGTVGDRDLVVYYDAGTEAVFYEVQRKSVEATPTTPLASAVDDGIRIELRATHPGGPLAVRVSNATADTPVDARVRLDGEPVGHTGGEALWTIAPRGPFTVTAATPDGNVTVTTSI